MIIKKLVETKRIKEIFVRYFIGKKLRIIIKYSIKIIFFFRSSIKETFRFITGIPFIIIYKDDIIKYQNIKSIIIEKKYKPNNRLFNDKEIPYIVKSFYNKKSYNYTISYIPDGILMGRSTIATKDNIILRDLTRWKNEGYATNPWSYMLFPKKTIKKKGVAIVLTGNDTFQNINHWILFGISKYYLYYKAGVKPDRYIIDDQKSFHQEAINALNIPYNQILVPENHTVYQFDTLIAASTPTIYGIIPAWMNKFFKDYFVKKDTSIGNKKIYLKRTGTRRILNEKEFDNYIKKNGYQIITTNPTKGESLDINIFSGASHIISTHGAGLSKMIFCKKGTKIIELFHPDTLFGHYYAMARSLGLKYYCFIGKKDKKYKGLDMDAPININIQEFEKKFKTIL